MRKGLCESYKYNDTHFDVPPQLHFWNTKLHLNRYFKYNTLIKKKCYPKMYLLKFQYFHRNVP